MCGVTPTSSLTISFTLEMKSNTDTVGGLLGSLAPSSSALQTSKKRRDPKWNTFTSELALSAARMVRFRSVSTTQKVVSRPFQSIGQRHVDEEGRKEA